MGSSHSESANLVLRKISRDCSAVTPSTKKVVERPEKLTRKMHEKGGGNVHGRRSVHMPRLQMLFHLRRILLRSFIQSFEPLDMVLELFDLLLHPIHLPHYMENEEEQ